jgi:hypothetical protein
LHPSDQEQDPDPQANVTGRIRISIKVKGRIRIRIKVKGRIQINIKVKRRIRIWIRINVLRIRSTAH